MQTSTDPGDELPDDTPPAQMVQKLLAKLPPTTASGEHLTPSQTIFNIKTRIDPRSLVIGNIDGTKHEFFLFMDMRKFYQWQSYRMLPAAFVQATKIFNQWLQHEDLRRGIGRTVEKHPRALVEKLGQVEDMILKRIKLQHYTCTRLPLFPVLCHGLAETDIGFVLAKSGREAFWMLHCHVVPLGKENDATRTGKGVRAKY